ncbi:MAG: hypothetical protein KDK30_16195, partial [Leptospiraceae bacterium]|nr:hypothetical protein [Leptospiraceae bacterium]
MKHMDEILSTDEINKLLNQLSSESAETIQPEVQLCVHQFSAHGDLSIPEIRKIQNQVKILLQSWERKLTDIISHRLNGEIIACQQMRHSALLRSIGTSTINIEASTASPIGNIHFIIDLDLAYSILDTMQGGSALAEAHYEELTGVEHALFTHVADELLRDLNTLTNNAYQVRPTIRSVEPATPLAAPPEPDNYLLAFDVMLNGALPLEACHIRLAFSTDGARRLLQCIDQHDRDYLKSTSLLKQNESVMRTGFHVRRCFPGQYMDRNDIINLKAGDSIRLATGRIRNRYGSQNIILQEVTDLKIHDTAPIRAEKGFLSDKINCEIRFSAGRYSQQDTGNEYKSTLKEFERQTGDLFWGGHKIASVKVDEQRNVVVTDRSFITKSIADENDQSNHMWTFDCRCVLARD